MLEMNLLSLVGAGMCLEREALQEILKKTDVGAKNMLATCIQQKYMAPCLFF